MPFRGLPPYVVAPWALCSWVWMAAGLAWGETGSSGGSVLRLVSGIEGKTPAAAGPEAIATPSPMDGLSPVPLPSAVDGQPGWNTPYQAGIEPAAAEPESTWLAWLPDGMVPIWGERTPLAERSIGKGEPLVGTSWLNRPLYAGWFAGTFIGDDFLAGAVEAKTGFWGGYRFGWDYDYYWGLETRIAATNVDLRNTDDTNRQKLGTAEVVSWDVDLLYYPWGDAKWRPYFLLGLGTTNVDFTDPFRNSYDEALFTMPVGLGLKVRCKEWLALRFEVADYFAIGTTGLEDMHNVTLVGGVDIHFGGHRRSYWPWNPNTFIW